MMPPSPPLGDPGLESPNDRRSERVSFCCWSPRCWSFFALTLAACSPDSLSVTDSDVVITVRDLGRSYASYRSYALPDAVIDVCAVPVPGAGGAAGAAGAGGAATDAAAREDCETLNHGYDQEILDAIRRNLDELGFSEVDRDDDPDVMILAAAVAQESWYVYYPYCDYWYGYCFDYGWGPTAVSYPVGTLAMYMASWRDADDETGKVPVIWLGVVSGLLSGSRELGEDRIDAGIDQAFAQSRYLGEGK